MQKKFRNALLQSVLVAVFILIAFLIIDFFDNTLFVTSLGASAFIAFAFPKAESVRIRYLIGGYTCGSAVGIIGSLLKGFMEDNSQYTIIFLCVLAVFLCSFCMMFFDLEHPPSAALAISITLSDKPFLLAFAAMISILALSVCKLTLLRVIHNMKKHK